MSTLVIKGVSRIFPGVHGGKPTEALQPTDLTVAHNDFVSILGPSGCGKSTLLRMIAGLDDISSGAAMDRRSPDQWPRAAAAQYLQWSSRAMRSFRT